MHFIRAGQTADSAIRARLNKMGKAAKNWVVVSSDRRCKAQRMSFKLKPFPLKPLQNCSKKTISASPRNYRKGKLTAAEVDEWLEIFQGKSTK
ncbi:hypothetical protein [Candidatus Villigracilis affinis]|uniref:hypothetical protein n=1 Tax=Candidatus Villigracilis affinis TaxID=3140682 RepID=UPI002A219A7F|nr:hypothetical protein [Anaerolineales bacterium]